MTGTTLYSIGHSNVSIEAFLALLHRFRISALVDARSRPYSRYNTHFSREPLKRALEEDGIRYLFLGDRIGGKPEDKNYLMENGRVDYEKLSSSELFLTGVEQLIKLGESGNICFMCAEADYKKCHRYWLITPALVQRQVIVKHILHSGEMADTDLSDFKIEQLRLF